MFSALKHYPARKYRSKVEHFQSLIGEDRRVTQELKDVTGMNRVKYFTRAVAPYNPIYASQDVFDSNILPATEVTENQNDTVRSVGTQSMFRVSESQTDPFSPDYVIKEGNEKPEILALSSLAYKNGLPIGLVELEMIERARLKRLWEATLPAVVDQETFERRLRMMEEMEMREWDQREIEIKILQDERLRALTSVIREREILNESENVKRIEKIWLKKMQEREVLFDKINRKRVTAMRKLTDRPSTPKKRDIIEEYGNYGSKIYDPKARDGVFRDSQATTVQIKADVENYDDLAKIKTVKERVTMNPILFDTPEKRRQKVLKQQLEIMNDKLVEKKVRKTAIVEPSKYSVLIAQTCPRPITPTILIPSDIDEEIEISAYIIQNLIRGRKVQCEMFQQKERALDLIHELQDRRDLLVVKVDITEDAESLEGPIQAEYVGQQLDFLTKQVVRLREEQRLAAMVRLANRSRRRREVIESGKRGEELIERDLQTALFRKKMRVKNETIETYLEEIIEMAVDESGLEIASKESEVDLRAESPTKSDKEIVDDLMFSFLIPHVDQTIKRDSIAANQVKYLLAAHNSIFNEEADV